MSQKMCIKTAISAQLKSNCAISGSD